VLRDFNLYDVFILSFVQLILSTVLVLSPAREIGTRFRWTGSRITEVLIGAVGAVAIAAFSCFVTAELWGLPAGSLEMGAYLLAIFSVIVIVLRPDFGVVGPIFYASYAAAGCAFLAFAAVVAFGAAHSVAEAVTSSFLLVLDLIAFIVWTSNVNYASDVLCRTRHSRPMPKADPGYVPMVSLHIPAHNEPPELLINTIKAAERIDYPNFEVVVIDNNTSDPAVWGPVEEYCRDRERVRFVHVAPLPGYKAGACNLALRRYTDPRAEIIGLIDADDVVQPHYLRETVPYFSDPRLGFLQTFEGNRDYEGSAYYTACVDSYQAFYLATMSSRNERDSVPFVGTMGLFRRSALVEIGGWNEWCISEDTEASLRVAKAGWSGLYLPRCFGRGIVPPSYAGLITQRHRWCFGAMQIFRLHWQSLMPWDRSPDNHLTAGQRRDYLMASLQWTRDLLMFAFSLLLLSITGLSLAGSRFALVPLAGDKSLLPMSLILIATVCLTWTLRDWTTMSRRRALLGMMISLASGWVTALACIEGMSRRDGVFLRTSKTGSAHHRLRTALRLCRVETLLMVGLYVSAGFLAARRHPPLLLTAIIAFQGTVYACAPIASLWNMRAQRVPAHAYRRRFEQRRIRQAGRGRPTLRVLGAATAAVVALGVGGMAGVFVAPISLLRANAIQRKAVSPQTMIRSSAADEVYVKLAPLSKRASYFPVTSVQLTQPSSSTSSPARFTLSFDASSLVLLNEVFGYDGKRRAISSFTLVVRKPAIGRQAARNEMADTFHQAVVTSLLEDFSGAPTGSVSLSLSALGHVLISPKTVGSSGPFSQAPASPGVVTARLKLGSASSRRAQYFSVTSVELIQPPGSTPALFNLSLDTSSLALLDAILHAGSSGRRIAALTLVVRNRGHGSGSATTLVTDTFREGFVTSFDESLSGSFTGQVALRAGGSTEAAASGH
jgi:cellulose synthase/poly-beta-1,6-N-acetylglucosamine synthase-like glycosyltransferase